METCQKEVRHNLKFARLQFFFGGGEGHTLMQSAELLGSANIPQFNAVVYGGG